MTIRINNLVLHILDNSTGVGAMSEKEMYPSLNIIELINKKIEKFIEDDNLKKATFSGNEMINICRGISNGDISFLEASKQTAERLFSIMLSNVDIPPADLLCCAFEYESNQWYGIFKLNYKQGYTHFVEMGEEGNVNTIINYQTLLPIEGQKVEEGAIINLNDFSIRLVEKEYLINDIKEKYFSLNFLECDTEMSNNEKVRILDKVTKKINKKYFEEDPEQLAKMKKVIVDNLEESNEVNIYQVASHCYGANTQIRDEYVQEISKAGIQEPVIQVSEKVATKKYRVHKIRTDTGVEINFPQEYFNNHEKMEFINNPDGTISIVIKNVGHIENK